MRIINATEGYTLTHPVEDKSIIEEITLTSFQMFCLWIFEIYWPFAQVMPNLHAASSFHVKISASSVRSLFYFGRHRNRPNFFTTFLIAFLPSLLTFTLSRKRLTVALKCAESAIDVT